MQVAILGASFAKAAYLPAFRHIPGVQVVAIAGARLRRAQAAADEFGIPHAYEDWRLLLERHPVDLVCIATPTHLHAPMTLAALDAGAHVLCEKPTAMNAAEAAAMLDRAETLHRLHMIDHELRFNPRRRHIKSMLDAGALGHIHHIQINNIGSSWADPASRPLGDWWSDAAQGGGRLGANGSHQVDLLRWWFGEIHAVSGQVKTLVPHRLDRASGRPWLATADDFVQFTADFAPAPNAPAPTAHVLISTVARHALGNDLQIVGSEGTLTLSNDTERLLFGRPGAPLQEIPVDDPDARLPGIQPGIWNSGVVAALRELCSAIEQSRPLREGATFLDGLRNQQVLDAIRRSSDERRSVPIPAYPHVLPDGPPARTTVTS